MKNFCKIIEGGVHDILLQVVNRDGSIRVRWEIMVDNETVNHSQKCDNIEDAFDYFSKINTVEDTRHIVDSMINFHKFGKKQKKIMEDELTSIALGSMDN